MPTVCQELPARRNVKVTGISQCGKSGWVVRTTAVTNSAPCRTAAGALTLGSFVRVSTGVPDAAPVALSNRAHDTLYNAGGEAIRTAAAAFSKVSVPSLLSRSEEHTSELQSQSNLVCRLLLE